MVELRSWPLFYDGIKEKLQCKTDVIVAVTHNFLTMEFDLVTLIDGSVRLPVGWKSGENIYQIDYKREGQVYRLTGKTIDDSISLSLSVGNDAKEGTFVNYKVDDVVSRIDGELSELVPGVKDFLADLKIRLIDKVLPQERAVVAAADPLQLPPPDYKSHCGLARDPKCYVIITGAIVSFGLLLYYFK